MTTEILNYLLVTGAVILIVLVSIGGFYIILILRDVSKVVSRVEEASEATRKYFIEPVYTFYKIFSKFKSVKDVMHYFSKGKSNEKKK